MNIKAARVIYVAPIPKERSGIGRDVPAHVKIEHYPPDDEQGRRHSYFLDISEHEAMRIGEFLKLDNIRLVSDEPLGGTKLLGVDKRGSQHAHIFGFKVDGKDKAFVKSLPDVE